MIHLSQGFTAFLLLIRIQMACAKLKIHNISSLLSKDNLHVLMYISISVYKYVYVYMDVCMCVCVYNIMYVC